jgi:hypothetical protein
MSWLGEEYRSNPNPTSVPVGFDLLGNKYVPEYMLNLISINRNSLAVPHELLKFVEVIEENSNGI